MQINLGIQRETLFFMQKDTSFCFDLHVSVNQIIYYIFLIDLCW